MSCDSVQERISSLLDHQLVSAEREDVSAHLQSCATCSARLQALESLRAALRGMNQSPVPPALAMRLRVIASHERWRHLSSISVSASLRCWGDRAELVFENLMRPLALPFAGGLLSALLLFGMLVPNLSFQHNFHDDLQLAFSSDPDGRLVESLPGEGSPTWLWTRDSVRLEPANAISSRDETVLELTIDEYGRVADYSVSQGQLTPEMQSLILWSRFTPGTLNGKKASGKVSVVFHRHHHVRG